MTICEGWWVQYWGPEDRQWEHLDKRVRSEPDAADVIAQHRRRDVAYGFPCDYRIIRVRVEEVETCSG